ncbi:TetR/AcrR family transcriptional regulator [Limosilactobacillus kribbianus]|uniref:TetR/AcrR family transcriptional regulator n=1 Tax=Limosilactobacillus kribbianus TaxID=2982695 RepID=UPI002263CE21|nr:TetR/AcrR family transcriptional regulator [Limosilactobacillus kribbianus]
MFNRQNAGAEKAKHSLATALLSLMEEMPFDQIRVVDIADRADYTRQTFYQHFKTKEAVLEYYVDDLYYQSFQEFGGQQDVSLEQLFSKLALDWQKHAAGIATIIDNDLTNYMERCYPAYIQHFLENSNWRLKENNPEKQEYIYHFIAGGEINLLAWWIRQKQQLAPAGLAALLQDTMTPFLTAK